MISPEALGNSIVIASSNPGKIAEFDRFLGDLGIKITLLPDKFHVEETGSTFAENAQLKALAFAKFTSKLSLADDSGLSIKHLGGAPGVHSARYASNDSQRIARVLKELEGVEDRSAFFTSALCIASPEGVFVEVQGQCDGVITKAPRGDNGFGYDPIFEVLDTGLTFAEMSLEMKRQLGHRGKAFELLHAELTSLKSN